MLNLFDKNVILEINKFRSNPKSIQHKCEIYYKDLKRLNFNDPNLKEIESFIKQLASMKPLQELIYNEELSNAARKELLDFGRTDNYHNNLKEKIPDYYLMTNPGLVAICGIEDPSSVLLETLFNINDKNKEGRTILCDSNYNQIGISHEKFKNENIVIIVLATKFIENKSIKIPENDFDINNKYGPLTPEIEEDLINTKFITCLNCSSAIEILSINNINNLIEYKCLEEKKIFTLKIKEYLDKLKEIKLKNRNEIKDKCTIHKNKEYICYCFDCNCNLCNECLEVRIHINHKKINIIEVKPKNDELNMIEDIIKYYQNKIENLRKENYNNKKEYKELLNKKKKNESKKLEKKIKKNKIKENKELEMNKNNFIYDLEKIKKEYENKIKSRKRLYEKENININNKYKLMNEKENIKYKINIEKIIKNYKCKYAKQIENVENIIKINKIILNNYNIYNNNYFNSVNIKNVLLSYLKNDYFNDKILKENIKDKYRESVEELNVLINNDKYEKKILNKNTIRNNINPKHRAGRTFMLNKYNINSNNSFSLLKTEVTPILNEYNTNSNNANNPNNKHRENISHLSPFNKRIFPNNSKNEKKLKSKPKNFLTILKRTFFQDIYQRYIKNEKITDYYLDELSKEAFNDRKLKEDDVEKNTKLFIETTILPLIQENKLNENELRIVKYNISKILKSIGLDEKLYISQYSSKPKTKIDRRTSQEAVLKFRNQFGIGKDIIKDEALENKLVKNNLDLEKTFQEMYD